MAIDIELRAIVNGLYDLQQVRIELGNRIVASFREKLGIVSDADMDKKAKSAIDKLRRDYERITDGIVKVNRKNFNPGKLIHTIPELMLIRQYVSILAQEEQVNKDVAILMKDKPLWNEFLLNVKGVGPKLGGVIMAYLDIEKAKYPSSFWKYCGVDVGPDGAGRSRRKEHLHKIQYINKKGEPKEKDGLTFNPKVKTKLVGVLGPSFLKAKGHYADIYNDYKNRLENHPNHKDKVKDHRHKMAIRYMVKEFLKDLHIFWRELEGLPVSKSYAEVKLGLKHSAKRN